MFAPPALRVPLHVEVGAFAFDCDRAVACAIVFRNHVNWFGLIGALRRKRNGAPVAMRPQGV